MSHDSQQPAAGSGAGKVFHVYFIIDPLHSFMTFRLYYVHQVYEKWNFEIGA